MPDIPLCRAKELADEAWQLRNAINSDRSLTDDERVAHWCQCVALLEQGREICLAHNGKSELSYVLAKLAQVRGAREGKARELKLFWEAAAAAREGNRGSLEGHALRHIAGIYHDQGKNQEAFELLEQAVASHQRDLTSGALELANTLRPYAIALAERGENESALRVFKEARAIYARLDIKPGVVEADQHIQRLSP